MKEVRLIGVTDASGDAVLRAPSSDYGLLYAVEWIDGDLANGVDAVLSCADTASGVAQTLLTLTDANDDAWYYPRTTTDTTAGVADTPTTYIVVNGTLTLTISSGGNAKTGGCLVHLL